MDPLAALADDVAVALVEDTLVLEVFDVAVAELVELDVDVEVGAVMLKKRLLKSGAVCPGSNMDRKKTSPLLEVCD